MTSDELRESLATLDTRAHVSEVAFAHVHESARRTAHRSARRRRMALLGGALAVGICGPATFAVLTLHDHGGPEQSLATEGRRDKDRSVTVLAQSTSASTTSDWHERTRTYYNRLVRIAEKSEAFAGNVVEDETRTIALYGVGKAPQAVIERAAQAPEDTTVEWHSVPHNSRQLKAAQAQLLAGIPEATIVQIGTDYASLVVSVDPEKDPDMAQLEQLAADLAGGIPVSFTEGGPVHTLDTGPPSHR